MRINLDDAGLFCKGFYHPLYSLASKNGWVKINKKNLEKLMYKICKSKRTTRRSVLRKLIRWTLYKGSIPRDIKKLEILTLNLLKHEAVIGDYRNRNQYISDTGGPSSEHFEEDE